MALWWLVDGFAELKGILSVLAGKYIYETAALLISNVIY